ncbi:Uncharacterized membrane protein YebE, DUF533 family [Poseidonocella pacifica]|uniref:Uncharacterized membrane protein YebE, DUF533 family n=1 Tax=Poseidonocella pacifica TaxID=871651 RepID=A0A1I0VK42_9RHOB|nr:DUF533 domain-containing protein [Poseidonocella pacifica]SFA76764.1 Uncharacterized membrane protein YebE, DUF533 family [Poseidonocella pacifica]
MGLLGTLTKVAVGYATAKGVDRLSSGGGLQDIMKQLQTSFGAKDAGANTGAFPGFSAGNNPFGGSLQDMATKMMSSGGGGTGLAGMLAAFGGLAASGQSGMQDMLKSTGNERANDEMEMQAGLMLRAMIQATKADGKIDEAEQKRILEMVGDDAEESDITFLRTQLAAPVDVDSLAGDTPPAQAAQVYSASLLAINVDTDAERAYLRDLGRALSLDPATVTALHMQMSAPQP